MFIKFAQVSSISVVPFDRISTAIFKKADRFVLEQLKEDFLYFSCVGIRGDYPPNDNGDMFPWEELNKRHITGKYVWETWKGKNLLENHNPQYVRGYIVDTYPEDKDKVVHMLNALNRKKYAQLAEDIKNGKITDTSMGVLVEKGVCSVCKNVAYDESQWCEHLRYEKGKKINGQLVYEINYGLEGLENSIITYGRGAEPMSKIREILAQYGFKTNKDIDNFIMKKFAEFCQNDLNVNVDDFIVYILEVVKFPKNTENN